MTKTKRDYKFTITTPKGWEWLDYIFVPLLTPYLMMKILFKKVFKRY